MKTFGSILDEHKGYGPGFDFARVALAIAVLLWHSQIIAKGQYGWMLERPLWVVNYSILPMFFGLSGFLVAGSAQRLDLKNFAINRSLRIFPALIVEITLSAIVLGLLFTKLPPAEYFTHVQFREYFLNILGYIHYVLPGVFLDNPNPVTVNGSLWTVPFEILCYIVMAALIVSGAIRKGATLVVIASVIIAAGVACQWLVGEGREASWAHGLMEAYMNSGKGPPLVPCFVLGAAAYVLRYRIPHSLTIFFGCLVALAAIGVRGHPGWWTYLGLVFFISPLMIYIVMFVGLSKIPKLPVYSKGDYSYGIYLYGFPIQQALAQNFPALRSMGAMFLVSLVVVTLFAMMSWHCIEKPVLKMRKRFSVAGRHRIAEDQGMAIKTAPAPETVNSSV